MHNLKTIFMFVCLSVMSCFCTCANGDSFDFDEFAIEDSTDVDITMEDVELNSDADIADVSSFDIAGIMLGMSFEDVYSLFFRENGLYAPRKKNAIIKSPYFI